MRAITIQQPWAHLIIHGWTDCDRNLTQHYKDVENRTWPCSYRGPLVIHAGKSRERLGFTNRFFGLDEAGLDFGAAIGVVEMFDCKTVSQVESRWAEGPWCHLYRNPKAFELPIPWQGSQGLWVPDPQLVALVEQELVLTEVNR